MLREGAPSKANVAGAGQHFENFDDFLEALCEVHFDWNIKRPDQNRISANVTRDALDDLLFTDVVVSQGLKGRRDKKHISRQSNAYFGLIMMLEGGQRLSQGHSEIELGSGDLTIWDASRPASFESSGTVRQISIFLPHEKIKLYAPNVSDLCARRIDSTSGLGYILASHLNALSEVGGIADQRSKSAMASVTLGLIGAAIRPESAGDHRSAITHALFREVQSFIINNLQDENLSPGMISRAFRISPRYLHKLFEGQEYTLSEWILMLRLDACQRALSDPALKHLTVTEIAFHWGFSGPSYFSRAFKRRYGLPPSDFRAQATAH